MLMTRWLKSEGKFQKHQPSMLSSPLLPDSKEMRLLGEIFLEPGKLVMKVWRLINHIAALSAIQILEECTAIIKEGEPICHV